MTIGVWLLEAWAGLNHRAGLVAPSHVFRPPLPPSPPVPPHLPISYFSLITCPWPSSNLPAPLATQIPRDLSLSKVEVLFSSQEPSLRLYPEPKGGQGVTLRGPLPYIKTFTYRSLLLFGLLSSVGW